MDDTAIRDTVAATWDTDILPSLAELVKIPAVSQAYDPAWQDNGQLRRAAEHLVGWARAQELAGATAEIVELAGRPPLVLIDVPPTADAATDQTVLIYGHLDKQPALEGWSEGLGPWQPVLRGDRLYGRGSVDDGYAGYAAVAAIRAVRASSGRHCRTVVLLETGEESGSPDLPAYLDELRSRLGSVSLVVCLDAGGGDFQRLWLTRSLRGIIQATLTVSILDSAVHSGIASGVAPGSFRVLRALLERIEDATTGQLLVPELNVAIPDHIVADARRLAALDSAATLRPLAFVTGARPTSAEETERILNNTWRPTLTVIGASGLPDAAVAGAVLRASTTLRLSFRLPPTADAKAAAAAVEHLLTSDVPYGAHAVVSDVTAQDGWYAPELPPWLSSALDDVSASVFGAGYQFLGIGGGIPFMRMLGDAYPESAFFVTGAVGAESNMHVPDEWLNIPFARRVTEAVAHVLDAHASQAN